MQRTTVFEHVMRLMLALSLAIALGACDDGEPNDPDDGGDDEGSVYAMLTLVLGDEDTTSYIQLSDSVEAEPSLDEAREFSGWASMAAVDETLLVTHGDAPKLTSYSVSGLKWKEGQTLNFANTGATAVDFAYIWMLDEKTAYLSLDTTSRVVFDPTALKIGEIVEDSELEVMRDDGMELSVSWHRQARLRDIDQVRIPYHYYKEYTYPGPSILAAYDPKTHEEEKLTEIDCEALEVESYDEEGNAYYSAWYSWQAGFLYDMAKATCVVKIDRDGAVADGWPRDFLDLTDGRPVAAWQYLENGKAVATVLHQDEGVPPTGEYNEDIELGPYYTWIFDLENNEAHPIEGIEPSGWGFQLTKVDDRFFMLVTNPEWTSTTAYELNVDEGTVERTFTTDGWVYDWFRVK